MIGEDFADLGEVRLHYAAAGSGKLVMLLHGFPEFWYAWKRQIEELSSEYFVVAPDMRGYNLSSKPVGVERYALPLLVEDVQNLARQLRGGERFALVGHDWGGVVAWAFALAHPDMLERLVIINAPHPAVFQRELRENPAQQQASQYMLVFRSPEAEALLSANNFAPLVEAVMGEGLKGGSFTDEDRLAYIEAWSQAGALTGGLNYYRAAAVGPPAEPGGSVALWDWTGSPLVTVPTLVVWGERDAALLTGNLEGLDRYVKDLTIRRVPQGTHWLVHEYPQLINDLIREHISRA